MGMDDLSIPVERHQLDNGLRVVFSVDTTVPIVAVNLWYAVGSRNEAPGRTGFAHLFEHMMFQGSLHVPKNGHFELIERAGGSMNGSTWFDRTNYFETLPAHQLDLGLWLESDRMGWMLPAMTQEKLDNQRDVVKNEKLQSYDNVPYGDWSERLQAMVFPEDHPYRHTVIGSMDDLEAATLEDVAGFFATYYVPNNCVLTLCGDFEPGAALARVRHFFDDIPAGAPIPPIPGKVDIDPVLGETSRERVTSQVPLPRTMVACRIPSYTDPDFYSADVASTVLGSGRASRLYRSLVREQRIAKDAGSFAYPLIGGTSMMLAWATGYPDADLDQLEDALLAELDRLPTVGSDEVARAVALSETSMVHSLEEVSERADLLARFTTFFDEPEALNSEMKRIRSVTPARIHAFAAERLGPNNRAVLTYVPEEAS